MPQNKGPLQGSGGWIHKIPWAKKFWKYILSGLGGPASPTLLRFLGDPSALKSLCFKLLLHTPPLSPCGRCCSVTGFSNVLQRGPGSRPAPGRRRPGFPQAGVGQSPRAALWADQKMLSLWTEKCYSDNSNLSQPPGMLTSMTPSSSMDTPQARPGRDTGRGCWRPGGLLESSCSRTSGT